MAKKRAVVKKDAPSPEGGGSVSVGLGLKPSVNFNGFRFDVTITKPIQPGESAEKAVHRIYQDVESAINEYTNEAMTLLSGYADRMKRGGR